MKKNLFTKKCLSNKKIVVRKIILILIYLFFTNILFSAYNLNRLKNLKNYKYIKTAVFFQNLLKKTYKIDFKSKIGGNSLYNPLLKNNIGYIILYKLVKKLNLKKESLKIIEVNNIIEFINVLKNINHKNFIYAIIVNSGIYNFSKFKTINIQNSIIIIGNNKNIKNQKNKIALPIFIVNDKSRRPLFKIHANNIYISNIIFKGPDPDIKDSTYKYPLSAGIYLFNSSNIYINNCEFSGWSHAAIGLYNSRRVVISNNIFHHNRRKGLGYGIVLVGYSSALIKENIFYANRHAIAGDGFPMQYYEACYNIVFPPNISHNFDMHPYNRKAVISVSGYKVDIHHNLFLDKKNYAIFIRGISKRISNIYENYFIHKSPFTAINFKLYTFDNTSQYNNYFEFSINF